MIKVIVLLAGLVGDPITKKYPKYSKIINDYLVSKTINLVKKSNWIILYLKQLVQIMD